MFLIQPSTNRSSVLQGGEDVTKRSVGSSIGKLMQDFVIRSCKVVITTAVAILIALILIRVQTEVLIDEMYAVHERKIMCHHRLEAAKAGMIYCQFGYMGKTWRGLAVPMEEE